MHRQTFGFWAWKQNSTKKHSIISFFRNLPGMLAVGMLTGKAVGHHMSTLMPALTPHLTGLGCFLFGSCFCFTPSCGGTKHKLFQSFIKVSLSCSLWFGHLPFVSLKKPLLGFIGLACCEPGMSMITGNIESKGSIPGIWPYFITAYFGMAQSSFLLVWLFFFNCWKKVPTVRKLLYYLPVLKKYPRCH